MGLTHSQRELLRTPNPIRRRRSYLSSLPSLSLARRSIGVVGRSVGVSGRTIGPADVIPDTEIDHFLQYEPDGDQQLSDNYSGDLSDHEITSSPTIEGNQALRATPPNDTTISLYSTDGLNQYPVPGYRFQAWVRIDVNDGQFDRHGLLWGGSSPTDCYQCHFIESNNEMFVGTRTGTNDFKNEDLTSVSLSSFEWYRWEVDWTEDWQITARLYEEDDEANPIGTVSWTDTDETYDSEAFGWMTRNGSSSGTLESVHDRGHVTDEL